MRGCLSRMVTFLFAWLGLCSSLDELLWCFGAATTSRCHLEPPKEEANDTHFCATNGSLRSESISCCALGETFECYAFTFLLDSTRQYAIVSARILVARQRTDEVCPIPRFGSKSSPASVSMSQPVLGRWDIYRTNLIACGLEKWNDALVGATEVVPIPQKSRHCAHGIILQRCFLVPSQSDCLGSAPPSSPSHGHPQ